MTWVDVGWLLVVQWSAYAMGYWVGAGTTRDRMKGEVFDVKKRFQEHLERLNRGAPHDP